MAEPAPAPYDDPTARTRLSWSRTMLLVSGVALLIGRGAFLADRVWLLVALAAVSIGLVALGLRRMRRLAKSGRAAPALGHRQVAWACVGLVAVALLAVATCLR